MYKHLTMYKDLSINKMVLWKFQNNHIVETHNNNILVSIELQDDNDVIYYEEQEGAHIRLNYDTFLIYNKQQKILCGAELTKIYISKEDWEGVYYEILDFDTLNM